MDIKQTSLCPNTEGDFPKVTVIAPCYNEVDLIDKSLNSILQNDYPHEKMEVIVVDGISNDGTNEKLRKIAKKDRRVKLLINPGRIQAKGMNIGLKQATGKYIVRMDCHSTYAPDYIQKGIELLKKTGADNVGGYLRTKPRKDNSIAKAIKSVTTNIFGVGHSKFRLKGKEQQVDTVPYGIFRKELFQKIGLYDERLVRNEDLELNYRIRKFGGKIIISPDIKLDYYCDDTYSKLLHRSFMNGLWNPYTALLTGGGPSLRHYVPLFFVVVFILTLFGSLLWPSLMWAWLIYGFYILLTTIFSMVSSIKDQCNFFLIFSAFVILHFSYGCGSLWSIITIPFKYRRCNILFRGFH